MLRQTFDETEAVPGQPLTLRLTVLVPSFMPKPPVWPDFQMPNVMVRVGSAGRRAERIGNETWSGVTRRYTIAPMVGGTFEVPAQAVAITWSDPETGEPRQAELATEPISFTGTIPEAAAGLDPFIAATALELAQAIEGTPEDLAPGDSVTRSVTGTISGVSPVMLPRLQPAIEIDAIASYPDEPAIVETDDRGVPGGSRSERVTLLAQGGGSGHVPEITLDWFNIDSGKIETARAEGFDISVSGPPTRSAAPGNSCPGSPQPLASPWSFFLPGNWRRSCIEG